jgi:hypothetical protein
MSRIKAAVLLYVVQWLIPMVLVPLIIYAVIHLDTWRSSWLAPTVFVMVLVSVGLSLLRGRARR